jgi:hypothetical protein
LFVFLLLSFFLSQQRGLADVTGDGSHRRAEPRNQGGRDDDHDPKPGDGERKWQVDGGLGERDVVGIEQAVEDLSGRRPRPAR